jgi:predicted permease
MGQGNGYVPHVVQGGTMQEYLQQLGRDLGYGRRLLIRSPGFSLTVLLSLAVGIGATVSIFTFVDALLLRPLPVRAPEQLFAIIESAKAPDTNGTPFSHGFYLHLRDSDPAFADLTASSASIAFGVNLFASGVSERVRVEVASGNYFRVLGVTPVAGRLIGDADDQAGTTPVAVVSYAFWQHHLGSRADIIGQTVTLNEHAFVVIGIASREFFGTRPGTVPDFWVPLMMVEQVSGSVRAGSASAYYLDFLVRLDPSTNPNGVAAKATTLYREWSANEVGRPSASSGSSGSSGSSASSAASAVHLPTLQAIATPAGASRVRGQYRQPLWILMAAASLLWLICCTNVATMFIARGAAREREMAVRAALGASRRQVVQQLLAESLLIGALGGIAGWFVSVYMTHALLLFFPDRSAASQFEPGWRVFGFAASLALVTGALFGLAPALAALRVDLVRSLRRGPGLLEAGRLWRSIGAREILSAAQISVAVVLIVEAMLFARTLRNLRAIDPGFQRDHVLMVSIDPLKSGYTPERAATLLHELADRVGQLHGVIAAGWASHGSLSGVLAVGGRFMSSPVHAQGRPQRPGELVQFYNNVIGPHYFAATRIPLLRGEDFTKPFQRGEAPVAILNDAAARELFPNEDPIGKRIGLTASGPAEVVVIGVVGNAKFLDLRESTQRVVYLPFDQRPLFGALTLHVRTTDDPTALVGPIQQELRRLDRSLPMFRIETISARIDESLRQERLVTLLVSALGVIGTVLAALGLYGLVSCFAVQRTRELGIRRALGAGRVSILGLTITGALRLAGLGVMTGALASLWATRWLASFLYGLAPTDVITILAAAIAVTAIVLIAAAIPAWRAARIDPLIALRHE